MIRDPNASGQMTWWETYGELAMFWGGFTAGAIVMAIMAGLLAWVLS